MEYYILYKQWDWRQNKKARGIVSPNVCNNIIIQIYIYIYIYRLRENPIGIQLESNFVSRVPSNLSFKFCTKWVHLV